MIGKEFVNLGEVMGGFELTGLSFGCFFCVFLQRLGPLGFFDGGDVDECE